MINTNETFTSNTTPIDNKTLFNATIRPTKTIPIIFLPGIMGSNLKSTQGRKVWYPPNTGGGKLWTLLSKIFGASPASRQIDLNPKTTVVGSDGYIKLDKKILPDTFTEELAIQRGWGSVYWDGYGQILMYLEAFLNTNMTNTIDFSLTNNTAKFFGTLPWRTITNIPAKPQTVMQGVEVKMPSKKEILQALWNPTKDFTPLEMAEFDKLANYNYPVFGLGYNWLQNNSDSAADVIKRLGTSVQAQIKKEFPNAPFERYIILTHSMGGLVARHMILDEGLKSKTIGVIHGVMPASGAPTVYKRFGNGWDGSEVTSKLEDYFAQVIFGATARSITPVLGNSPGALSLLPFTNFRNNGNHTWLTLKAKKLDGSPIELKLPKNPDNVFEEIYLETGTWWRMVNDEFLDPANLLKQKSHAELGEEKAGIAGAAIGSLAGSISNAIGGDSNSTNNEDVNVTPSDLYRSNVLLVQEFQDEIKNSYFDTTYAHYGNDEKFKAFDEVIWETDNRIDVNEPDDLLYFTGEEFKKNENTSTSYDPATNTHIMSTIQVSNGYWEKELFRSNGERCIRIKGKSDVIFKLHVAPTKAGAGDGTVCHQSASDVQREKVKQVFVINGYDHANSYKNENVKQSVLYCVAKIMQTA